MTPARDPKQVRFTVVAVVAIAAAIVAVDVEIAKPQQSPPLPQSSPLPRSHERPWAPLEPLRTPLGAFWASLGDLGVSLGPSWPCWGLRRLLGSKIKANIFEIFAFSTIWATIFGIFAFSKFSSNTFWIFEKQTKSKHFWKFWRTAQRKQTK